jgi:hypothetical protein
MTDLPPLPVLAALLRIDLDDPADRDDVAALADLPVRRELRALRDDLPPPPPRLRVPW